MIKLDLGRMPLLPRSGIGANLKSKLGRVSPKNPFPRLISILCNFLTICKVVLYLLLKFDHLPLRLPLLVEELLLLLLQPPPDPLLVLHDPVQRVPLLTHRLPLAPLSRVEQTFHVEYFSERVEFVVPSQYEAWLSLVLTQAASSRASSDNLFYVLKKVLKKKSFVSNYVELLMRSGRRAKAYQLGRAQAHQRVVFLTIIHNQSKEHGALSAGQSYFSQSGEKH